MERTHTSPSGHRWAWVDDPGHWVRDVDGLIGFALAHPDGLDGIDRDHPVGCPFPEHNHIPDSQIRAEYVGPCAGRLEDENPKAHGGFAIVQRCECGAVRRVNIREVRTEVSDPTCPAWADAKSVTRVDSHYEWGQWFDPSTL